MWFLEELTLIKVYLMITIDYLCMEAQIILIRKVYINLRLQKNLEVINLFILNLTEFYWLENLYINF